MLATLRLIRKVALEQVPLQAQLGAVQDRVLLEHPASQVQVLDHQVGLHQAGLDLALKEGLEGVAQVQALKQNVYLQMQAVVLVWLQVCSASKQQNKAIKPVMSCLQHSV